MFKFITDKPFWVNLLAALVLAVFLIFFVLQMLGVMTNHGSYLTVPSVVGKKTDEAVTGARRAGWRSPPRHRGADRHGVSGAVTRGSDSDRRAMSFTQRNPM